MSYCTSCHSYRCNCNSSCNTDCDGTCPIKLDFTCILYHKANSSLSNYANLNITNGANLEMVIDALNSKIEQLNVPDWDLSYLRASVVINTLEQFGEAVDDELADLQAQIDSLSLSAAVALVTTDTNSIDFSTSGSLDHTLTANVKISGTVDNLVSILGDGLFVTPQTLSVDYELKQLTISNGNTVDLAALTCGVGGFLGNFETDDPTAIDGQTWFRTDLAIADAFRIKLNGDVRVIETSAP